MTKIALLGSAQPQDPMQTSQLNKHTKNKI